jgi:hypothetical protein
LGSLLSDNSIDLIALCVKHVSAVDLYQIICYNKLTDYVNEEDARMNFLIRMALLAAAAAAGIGLALRRSKSDEPTGEQVVYLGEDDAVIDPERPPVPATVKSCFRRMDPLSLNAANEAIFLLEDGSEVRQNFSGDGGLHLKPGDRGMLTWRGMHLIRFEKESGEVIGGMFYSPAEEAAHE